ncbi:RES domain-containing protein [Nocardioides alcanivorans]|uniref:RES domain-containing protein n=1 Tax=Nocardioides alcanivorans TaxID=2897352 RepID=UPI0035D7A551
MAGRFDLPAPRGTSYLASSREVAARERLGTQIRKALGGESVLETVLRAADGPVVVSDVAITTVRSANLPVKPAGAWINRSLWAGTGSYGVTQAWAASFDAAGFDSIVYPPRFSLGQRDRSLAMFGAAGAPAKPAPVGETVDLRDVLRQAGVRVVSPPRRAGPAILPASSPPPPL